MTLCGSLSLHSIASIDLFLPYIAVHTTNVMGVQVSKWMNKRERKKKMEKDEARRRKKPPYEISR